MKASKYLTHKVLFGLLLILLSVLVYAIHYAIFRDAHHIFLYMVGDIAFVFVEVLLVTLIIHQIWVQVSFYVVAQADCGRFL